MAILRRMSLTKLDLIGLKCPQPVLRTRKALKSLSPGDRLEVHCSDPLAAIDIGQYITRFRDMVRIAEGGELLACLDRAGAGIRIIGPGVG